MAKASSEIAYDMGLHAAKKAFLTMVTVWETIPPDLRSAAMAVSIAYLLHKCDGATHPMTADGNTRWAEAVEEMRKTFNEDLEKQIAASKVLTAQRRY